MQYPLFPASWVVTSAGAFDTKLGILNSGKEAHVFLIERAVPNDPARSSILAAKRYRGRETSNFHRSLQYQEGRRMRNTRDTRAVERNSAYGKVVSAGRWAYAEFEVLCRMHVQGMPVRHPVQVNGTELLMEFIGDGLAAAPRLAEVRAERDVLAGYLEQVLDILHRFAAAGLAHGDLSAYNLLVHAGCVVVDLPQLVEVVSNPNGLALMHRDCVNVCGWFTRRGVDCDADDVFAALLQPLCALQ